MRNKLILTVAAVAAFTACSTAVKAAQIDGIVSVIGNVVFSPDNGLLSTALSVPTTLSWNNSRVWNTGFGDFVSMVNPNPITMKQWTFTPSGTAPGSFNFITLPGGFYYTLAPGGVITLQDNADLVIHTTGTISGPGFDPTPGVFNFSTQGPATPGANGNEYTWSGAVGSVARFQVPDGGTTALMLGSVFLVIGFLRNKLVA